MSTASSSFTKIYVAMARPPEDESGWQALRGETDKRVYSSVAEFMASAEVCDYAGVVEAYVDKEKLTTNSGVAAKLAVSPRGIKGFFSRDVDGDVIQNPEFEEARADTELVYR